MDKVKDLVGALRGPVTKELMTREGQRMRMKSKLPGEEPVEHDGEVDQPRSVERSFQSEDAMSDEDLDKALNS
jgi:hypothetical protein